MQGSSLDFNNQVKLVLLENIPGAINVKMSSPDEDRAGTDWWVIPKNGRPLSVDLKARETDFREKTGKDDLALEIWSVKERAKVGWTRDLAKTTDYVLWFWKDTKRWCLIPFPMLCKVFIANYLTWSAQYETAIQFTPSTSSGYHSECVFVPRKVVWLEIIKTYGG